MPVQELCYSFGIPHVPFHPQAQGFQPLEEQEAAKWRRRGPQVPHCLTSGPLNESCGAISFGEIQTVECRIGLR